MIFDECHHAQKEHPMLMLMAKFKEYPEQVHPRVIGLTGMLTVPSIKPMNVLSDLHRLEGTFRATITTAKGDDQFNDVLIYSTAPNESVLSYDSYFIDEFHRFIDMKIKKMLALIESWPLDDGHDIICDRRSEKQPKMQTKYENICKNFLYQACNLGLSFLIFKTS